VGQYSIGANTRVKPTTSSVADFGNQWRSGYVGYCIVTIDCSGHVEQPSGCSTIHANGGYWSCRHQAFADFY
jgi:hypothetical protein